MSDIIRQLTAESHEVLEKNGTRDIVRLGIALVDGDEMLGVIIYTAFVCA